MGETDPFDDLINRAQALDEFAASIQAEYPSHVSRHDLRVFRDQYRAWYYAGRARLPEDLKRRFDQLYKGGRIKTSIRSFLDQSTQKAWGRKIKTVEENPTSPANWQVRYGISFKQPFEEQCDILREAQGRPPGTLDITRLHPRIQAASAGLFEDGHYRHAILDACLALNEPVRKKSGSNADDGTALMQHVFSPKDPMLRVSQFEGEQQGVMFLLSGAMMGLRNPSGHHLNTDAAMTREECLEWLGFLSALMRVVDNAEKPTIVDADA